MRSIKSIAIINCINSYVCISKHIHCHHTSTNSICKINLIAKYSAIYASIYAHQSPMVYINVISNKSCFNCKIYAHEQLGSKLYIHVPSTLGMRQPSLYAPVDEGLHAFFGTTIKEYI